MIEVELFRILRSDQTAECAMFLREKNGKRTFPIMIGPNEMREIDAKVHGRSPQRPMTHDLLGALIDAARLQLERVVITELKDDVFYARMEFKGPEAAAFHLDARPSDAVAIATAKRAPLFAAEAILDAIGVVESDDEAA